MPILRLCCKSSMVLRRRLLLLLRLDRLQIGIMPTIQTPDGLVDFPDSMKDADIEAVLQKQYGAPKAAPVATPTGQTADRNNADYSDSRWACRFSRQHEGCRY